MKRISKKVKTAYENSVKGRKINNEEHNEKTSL